MGNSHSICSGIDIGDGPCGGWFPPSPMPMGRADQSASSVFTRQPKTWRRWHLSKDNRGSEGTANGLGYKRKDRLCSGREPGDGSRRRVDPGGGRSEEHTSELQSLMRISSAVFGLKKKTN